MKELKFRFMVWWYSVVLSNLWDKGYYKRSWNTVTGMSNPTHGYEVLNAKTDNLVYKKTVTYVYYSCGRYVRQVRRKFNPENL